MVKKEVVDTGETEVQVEEVPQNAAEELYTHQGYPVMDALAHLDDVLPSAAYKELTGGRGKAAGLTDILFPYQLDLLAKYIGPLGLGWGYEELEFTFVDGIAASKLELWYNVYTKDKENKLQRSGKIRWTARGGNANQGEAHWAAKGSTTNTIGAGWSLQGLQSSVYKGIRSHLTPDATAGNTIVDAKDADEFEKRAEDRKKLVKVYGELAKHFDRLGVSKDDAAKRTLLKASGIAESFNNMDLSQVEAFVGYLENEAQAPK